MRELITVISTVKNGERTISETLDSVINQTYDNWEMIIIDDASTDTTRDILKKYENKESRIKVFYSTGLGRGKALNKAIQLAEGKYIANLDADDLIHPNRLEYQYKVFAEKKNVFLVSSDTTLIYDQATPEWEEEIYNSHAIKQIGKTLLVRNQINHSSVLMSTEHLRELGNYNEDRNSQLDYELWLRALNKNAEIYILKLKLTAKRIHANQSFENKKRLKYTLSSMKLQYKYILKSKQYNFLPIPFILFLLSLLPFKIRRSINSFFSSEK